MMNRTPLALALALVLLSGSSATKAAQRLETDASTSAGAAAGFCLAKHPFRPVAGTAGGYTTEGFEVLKGYGGVAAIRRSFVANRISPTAGMDNTCAKACGELAKLLTNVDGHSLTRKFGNKVVPSGIADIGEGIPFDTPEDRPREVAGAYGRADPGYLEAAVTHGDFCCCEMRSKPRQQ